MEIQEKNNLLQQIFLSKAENFLAAEFSDKGFADMLKPQKDENMVVADKVDATVDFKRDEYIKTDSSLRDKQNVSFEDKKVENKKANAKEEASVVEKDKTTNNKVKEKVKEEAGATAAQRESSEVSIPQEEREISPAQENIAASDGKVESEIVSDIVVDAEMALSPVQTLLNVVSVDEMSVEPEKIIADEIVPENIADDALVNQVVSEEAAPVLEGEDALLFEQAKYLDKKIASQDKIKIEVNIAEDKVEAPVAKEILQNRFEVDSLLQNVDHDETIIQDDLNPDIVLNKEKAPSTAKSAAENLINAFAYKTEGQAVKEVSIRPQAEASNLAISGKEVVFETSNNLRAETFSRLNESSSRDTFKGMGKEVVEQIKINITKSAIKGVDTIDIQLKPEDLGKIQIRMHIAKDGKLHADIISSRPETMDMLQKDVSGLQKAFNDAGYDTDSRSFNFSFQKENQTRDGQNTSSDLMQFIGDTLEQEAKDIAGNDNLEYDPILGLNIRV